MVLRNFLGLDNKIFRVDLNKFVALFDSFSCSFERFCLVLFIDDSKLIPFIILASKDGCISGSSNFMYEVTNSVELLLERLGEVKYYRVVGEESIIDLYDSTVMMLDYSCFRGKCTNRLLVLDSISRKGFKKIGLLDRVLFRRGIFDLRLFRDADSIFRHNFIHLNILFDFDDFSTEIINDVPHPIYINYDLFRYIQCVKKGFSIDIRYLSNFLRNIFSGKLEFNVENCELLDFIYHLIKYFDGFVGNSRLLLSLFDKICVETCGKTYYIRVMDRMDYPYFLSCPGNTIFLCRDKVSHYNVGGTYIDYLDGYIRVSFKLPVRSRAP
jgi:hypothetical protein